MVWLKKFEPIIFSLGNIEQICISVYSLENYSKYPKSALETQKVTLNLETNSKQAFQLLYMIHIFGSKNAQIKKQSTPS